MKSSLYSWNHFHTIPAVWQGALSYWKMFLSSEKIIAFNDMVVGQSKKKVTSTWMTRFFSAEHWPNHHTFSIVFSHHVYWRHHGMTTCSMTTHTHPCLRENMTLRIRWIFFNDRRCGFDARELIEDTFNDEYWFVWEFWLAYNLNLCQ